MNYKSITTLSILFLFIGNSFAQNINVSYYGDSPKQTIQKQLFAKIGTQTYNLLDSSVACYAILDVRDYNHDNINDILVANVQGCGSDCCGNSFFFFSYNSTKKSFVKTEEVGYDFRKKPDINRFKNRWSISVQSKVRNGTKDDSKDIYVLMGDSIVNPRTGKAALPDPLPPVEPQVDSLKIAPINLISVIHASQFDQNKTGLRKILQYDLNNDQKVDTLVATYWKDWGDGMHWHIHFGDGSIDQKAKAAKSIGILNSKTNGYNRLMLDDSIVLYWNGQAYSAHAMADPNPPRIDPKPIGNPTAARMDFFYYKVKKKGESLSTIAYKHGSSVGAIKALNGKIRDLVKVGESLKIPKKENGGFKIHVVEMDQTLWAISRKYKVSVEKIRAANQLSDNTIKFGKIIRIPKA